MIIKKRLLYREALWVITEFYSNGEETDPQKQPCPVRWFVLK